MKKMVRKPQIKLIPDKPVMDFPALVERFEKTREYVTGKESKGMLSDRDKRYKVPAYNVQDIAKIKMIRNYLHELRKHPEFKADETYEIPRSNQQELYATEAEELEAHEEAIQSGKRFLWPWKPDKIELYGITRRKLALIQTDCLMTHRTLRIASIHGATHSLVTLEYLVRNHVAFDFAMYVNLPNEMPDEREYVLYYTRVVLKVPLVMIIPLDDADTYFFRAQAFPTPGLRWCTKYMKLQPIERFLADTFLKIPKGNYIDVITFLGLQQHQSIGRSKLSPDATPSLTSTPPYIDYMYKSEINPKTGRMHKVPIYMMWKNPKTGEKIPGRRLKGVNWPAKTMSEWFQKKPNAIVMRVFNMLPTFYYKPEDNAKTLRRIIDPIRNAPIYQNPNELEYGSHGCLVCPYKSWEFYHHLKKFHPALYKEAIERRDLATEILRKKQSYISKKTGETKKREAVFTQFGGRRFTKVMEAYGYTREDPPF